MNPMKYADRNVCEATMYEADSKGVHIGQALRETGHLTLRTIARDPQVIAAVNRVRETIPKDEWRTLAASKLTPEQQKLAGVVWAAMPGYCCLNDAVVILAKL